MPQAGGIESLNCGDYDCMTVKDNTMTSISFTVSSTAGDQIAGFISMSKPSGMTCVYAHFVVDGAYLQNSSGIQPNVLTTDGIVSVMAQGDVWGTDNIDAGIFKANSLVCRELSGNEYFIGMKGYVNLASIVNSLSTSGFYIYHKGTWTPTNNTFYVKGKPHIISYWVKV